MAHVWKPHGRYEGQFDTECCSASVHETGRGCRMYQCRRKWKVEENGHKWCSQHAPSAEAKRDKKRQDDYNAKWDARMASEKRQAIRTTIAALRKAGHNDLADEVKRVLR